MKRILLTFLLVCVFTLPAILTFAQMGQGMTENPLLKKTNVNIEQASPIQTLIPRDYILSEDFSSGTFPPAGWAILGGGEENWKVWPSENAGGEAPEVGFCWGPPHFEGNTKLVSHELSTSGNTTLLLEFKHYVWDFAGSGYTYKVETTSDGGNTWNEVWAISPTGDIEPETLTLVIDNDDVGSDNFQIAFTFDGNTTQINYWYFDDVLLTSGTGGTYSVTYIVNDMDANPVDMARIDMQNGGTKYTDASGQVTFDNVFPGTYTWDVSANLLAPASGTVTVEDSDVNVEVMMEPATELLFQEFAGGEFPPEGWSIQGDNLVNWSRSFTDNAGGEYPEAMFRSTPVFTGTTKLVTPVIATVSQEALFLEFKQYVDDNAGEGYILKVETTSDGGETWNEAWSVSPSAAIGPEDVTVIITTEDVGSNEFQIAFTFDGNSANINHWYLDKIRLTTALAKDAGIVSIDVPSLSISGVEMALATTVVNAGFEPISFDVTLEIVDGTAVYSELITVNNLAPLDTKSVVFPDWTTVSGSYDIEVSANLVGDENIENDMMSKDFEVADGLVSKKSLYEVFTSSTCPPCPIANNVIDSILDANPNEYTLIKYQMNWPGVGDPYYTAECGERADYYNVASVPDLYINSEQHYPAYTLTQEVFDQYNNTETALEIEITEAVINADNTLSVTAELMSIVNYDPGLTAHIVVVEKLTVGNVGSNGEEEFHHVMMKMLPDATGIILDQIGAGSSITLEESCDMSLTNMETPDDLAVIVFVQDGTDKSILQSETIDVTIATGIAGNMSSDEEISVFPNPASDKLFITSISDIQKIEIYNQAGQLMKDSDTKGNALHINTANLESGIYFLKIFLLDSNTTRKLIIE